MFNTNLVKLRNIGLNVTYNRCSDVPFQDIMNNKGKKKCP